MAEYFRCRLIIRMLATEGKEKNLKEKRSIIAVKIGLEKLKLAETETTRVPIRFEKGQILRVSGLPDKYVDYNLIRKVFLNFGKVAFVAYRSDPTEVCLKFIPSN